MNWGTDNAAPKQSIADRILKRCLKQKVSVWGLESKPQSAALISSSVRSTIEAGALEHSVTQAKMIRTVCFIKRYSHRIQMVLYKTYSWNTIQGMTWVFLYTNLYFNIEIDSRFKTHIYLG